MIPVCIPLHPRGGKLRDNSELKFAVRSLLENLRGDFEIVIVGPKLPDWGQGFRHIDHTGGLKSALVAAANAFPDGFFWWYDDCVLLRETTLEEAMVTPCCRGWRKARTSWSRQLEAIRARLAKEGHHARDYSRPHGPYYFDKGMVDEAFADWPGMAAKFPFESWILSKRKWPGVHGAVKQYYGPFKGAPGGQRYLNWNDRGFSPELRDWLTQRFPRPSRHEAGQADVAWPERRVKLEVHTIRFGESWWVKACAPTLDAWAAKWGHSLRIWGKEDIDPSYPAEKFCEVDMLREFLAGDAEWLLYVDADVYVHPGAPPHPDFSGKEGFLIRPDRPGKYSRHFPRWCERRFPSTDRLARRWTYRNAGVWACDRSAAAALLSVISAPYHACVQEQHHWNWWLALAHHHGMPVADLPCGWNAWPAEDGRAAFFHLCGRKKAAKFKTLQDKDLIPGGRPATPPVIMHASVMQFFSRVCSPERIRGKRVLEVGSFNVNGSVRAAVMNLEPAEYRGVDMLPQELFVDEVVRAEDLVERFGEGSWDVVLTAEMLEHAERWQAVVENLRGVLAPGGLLVMSARSEGFPLHSYPGDHWRFSTTDIAALFADFATLHLSEDSDPARPGFFYAGIKPPHNLVARPTPAPAPPYHSKEGYEKRMSERRARTIIPDPVAAFYHVACMGPWKSVVAEQCEALARMGIRPRAFVLGTPEDVEWLSSMPLDVIGSDPTLTNYETPTLAALWRWCRENPGGAVLYLHTKGVSRPADANVRAWRELMMAHVVGKFPENLGKLAVADGVGVNWKWWKAGLSHFSGNFWLARADWVSHLEDPWIHRTKGGPVIKGSPWDRMHAEMWFNSRPWYQVESLCCTEENLYSGPLVHRLLAEARQDAAGAGVI